MARDIRPLTSNAISELSQFLTVGFRTPPDADFTSPDVLRWKYLDSTDPSDAATEAGTAAQASADSSIAPRSYVARDETGAIIGHLGVCRTAFEGRALAEHGGRVATINIIDWLGSPGHGAIGVSLMRKAHDGVPTQFGLGVSQAALVVGERIGYELRGLVPVYTRVLRGGYGMRTDQSSVVARCLRTVRDTAIRWLQPPAAPRATIQLKRVDTFGPEIEPIVEKAKEHAILTRRDPARLNAMLRFPRQMITGWHLLDATGRLCGMAILNVVPQHQGRTRTGKVVDCLLDDIALEPWHAALWALTSELKRQGADRALAYASTPWSAQALCQSGYRSRFGAKFHIRDPKALMPRQAIFHLTPLEGDFAYT